MIKKRDVSKPYCHEQKTWHIRYMSKYIQIGKKN